MQLLWQSEWWADSPRQFSAVITWLNYSNMVNLHKIWQAAKWQKIFNSVYIFSVVMKQELYRSCTNISTTYTTSYHNICNISGRYNKNRSEDLINQRNNNSKKNNWAHQLEIIRDLIWIRGAKILTEVPYWEEPSCQLSTSRTMTAVFFWSETIHTKHDSNRVYHRMGGCYLNVIILYKTDLVKVSQLVCWDSSSSQNF